MARNLDGALDYLEAAGAFLSGSTGPFVVGGWWKPAGLAGSAGYLFASGSIASNHWRIGWESTADSLTFHKSGGSGTDPATSSAIAFDSADVSSGARFAFRYRGQSGEWSKWKGTGDGGRATVTKTVINASISFTLPTLSSISSISPTAQIVAGDVAELYIIAADLTDEQMQALLRGVAADQVARVTAYWPMRGTTLPEPDYSALPAVTGGVPMALGTGAACVAATHPTVIGLDDLRTPAQLHAWVADVYHADETIYAASASLFDPIDVDVLGASYQRLIVNPNDIEVSRSIADGIGTLRNAPTITLHKKPRLGLCTTYASAVFDDEPIAYWRCGDPATTRSGVTNATLYDHGPNGFHGSVNGTITYGTTGALSGDTDTAITVNGSIANYVLVPNGISALQSLKQAMSVECWFKPAATTGQFGLIENTSSSAASKHFSLFVDGATIYANFVISNTSYLPSYAVPGNLSTSTWYHVVGTYDGTNARLYVNGTLRATTAAAGGLDTGTFQTYIGRLYSTSYSLNGAIDEVAVYDHTLSAAQVDRHYTIGTSGARDWRGAPVLLRRYERSSHELVTEISGVVSDVDFSRPGRVSFTLRERDDAVFDTLIPKRIVNVDEHPVGDTVPDVGAPIPAVFGQALYTAPFLGEDASTSPGGGYFAVGHLKDAAGGTMNLRFREAYYDVFSGTAEKDRAGNWAAAPGTVTYHDADEFNVTSSGNGRYEVGMPVRFKTTASPTNYVYSYVTNWDSVNYRVRVADAVLDAGLTSVQVYDGVIVDVSTYTSNGEPVMAIRTNGAVPDTGVVIEAKNGDISNPAEVVAEILENSEWGLGLALDSGTFTTAASDFAAVGSGSPLATACNYALGGDKQQRRASDVLREILSMRGAWIEYDASGEAWKLYVDKAAASVWRSFGYADGYLNNVKAVAFDRQTPLSEMIARVNLRYGPIGRVKSATDGAVVFVGSNDFLYSLFGVAQSRGQSLVVTNPWLRGYAAAKEVVAYLGKRVRIEDAQKHLVCGPCARNVALGEAIEVKCSPQGFTGTMRVRGYRRRLGDVVLECFPYNSMLYSTATAADLDYEDGTGTETQADSANDVADKTYSPRAGTNFVRNAGFGIAPRKSTAGSFIDASVLPGWLVTNGTTRTLSISATQSAGAVGGAYLTVAVASGSGGTNPAITTNARLDNYLDYLVLPLKQGEIGMFSWYTDAPDNFFAEVSFLNTSGSTLSSITPLVVRKDSSSTNGLGWARYYAVFRATDATAAYATLSLRSNGTGTFKLDAVKGEIAGKGATKPSEWSAGLDMGLMLTRTESVTLSSGATVASDSTNKILPAGAVLMQVSYKVTTAVTGATTWSLGPTGGTATLYANAFANTVNGTGNAVVNGNGFTPAAGIATANTLTFTANGSNFTGGVVSVTVHYYLHGVPV